MVIGLPFDRLRVRVRLRWISIIKKIRGQRLVLTLVRIRVILRFAVRDSRPTSLDRYNPLDSRSEIRVRLRWIGIILLVARLMACADAGRIRVIRIKVLRDMQNIC